MSSDLSSSDQAKFVAAKRACEFVKDGMKLGLGTGSTPLGWSGVLLSA